MEEQLMMKLLGCLLIIGASSLIGVVFAEELKKRAIQLRELQNAVLLLQNYIGFVHSTLPEAFQKISERCSEPISYLFEEVGKKLQCNEVSSILEAFSIALSNQKNSFKLKKEDKDILLDLARGMEESDLEGHKKIFLLVDENLRKNIEEADCLINKNAKLYRYLGFSFGAVVAILLI
jgi:stage III sporulation protein AB